MKKILMVLTLLSALVCCGAVSASDPAASVVITPQNPQIEVGQSVDLTAQGYDNNGNPVQIQDPNWEWDPQYGTLTVDSVNPCQASFQATAPGTGYALCYEGPPSQQIAYGSTDITIQGGGAYLARIDVTPTTTTLRVGDTTVFTATGYDQHGNVYQIDPIWSTNGGTINQNGKYTGTVPGDFEVTASVSGSTVTGTGNVQVKAAPYLTRIEVSPSNVNLHTYDTQTFTATGYDQFGALYPITPVWSTNGGVINQNGIYTSTVPGDFTVTASDQGVTGSARVTNWDPYLASIVVTPSNVELQPGNTTLFTATGYDQYGHEYAINPAWSTNGGTINQNGRYTATIVGDFTVSAYYMGVTGSASVKVKQDPFLDYIVVTPGALDLKLGDQQQFTATGYDLYGEVCPIIPVWSTTGGTIDQNGFYTGSADGVFTVTASVGSKSGQSTVKVKTVPVLTSIVVTPSSATLWLYGTSRKPEKQFTATGYDQYGEEFPINPIWTTTGGTIDQNGLFTGTYTGDFTVTASDGSISGQSTVKVNTTQLLRKIIVLPGYRTIHPGQQIQYTAIGYDQDNVEMMFTPVWSINGENVGTITQNGLFTAGDNFSGEHILYAIICSCSEIRDHATGEIIKLGSFGGSASMAWDYPAIVLNTAQNGYSGQNSATGTNNQNGSTGNNNQNGATTTNTNNSPPTNNDTSPLIYLGGALVVVLVGLGIYKLM